MLVWVDTGRWWPWRRLDWNQSRCYSFTIRIGVVRSVTMPACVFPVIHRWLSTNIRCATARVQPR